MPILRKLFWIALFLASTFCFIVLFEHGPQNFAQNCQVELQNMQKLFNKKIERKGDESDKAGK
jgi:hypothetical protein